MSDKEKDFFEEENLFHQNRINNVISKFDKKGISGYYAENKESAKSIVFNLLKDFENNKNEKTVIGFGDSLSLHQINLFDDMYKEKDKYIFLNPFERLADGRFSEFKGLPNEWLPSEVYDSIHQKVWEKARKALLSDVFLTGANAITMDGKIVSTDGVGNRISAVIFGPYKVIMVVGRNKIVADVEEALNRIKNIAAPLNHIRHAHKHSIGKEKKEKKDSLYQLSKLPCVKKGYCCDCGSPSCTRRCTMIMESGTGGIYKKRIHLVIVNEDLGC